MAAVRTQCACGLMARPAAPRVEGVEPQPGRINYLLGSDSSRWLRDIPAYSRVRVHDLYPGVDAVYYTDGGRLETDFVYSNPGPSPMRLPFTSRAPGPPVLAANGDALLRTQAGGDRSPAPAGCISGVQRQAASGSRPLYPSQLRAPSPVRGWYRITTRQHHSWSIPCSRIPPISAAAGTKPRCELPLTARQFLSGRHDRVGELSGDETEQSRPSAGADSTTCW